MGAQPIQVTDSSELRGSIWMPHTVLIHRWPVLSVSQARIEAENVINNYELKAV